MIVNAHTHIYSGLLPLMARASLPPTVAPASFRAILETLWWRLDRALDAASLRAAARLYVANALAHRTAVLVDHHESPACIDGSLDIIADVCQSLGLPAVLCYGATERNGGLAEARRGLAECDRFLRSNDRPLVRGVVGLHASFTVSDEAIREAGELCRRHRTVLHVHVAEDRLDVDDARRRGYAGPLERLDVLGALPRGSILAHGVHLDADEVRHVAARGWWIVQNPRSNEHNGVGYPRAIGCASRIALGTDGFPSDMDAEFAALCRLAAVYGESASRMTARLHNGALLAAQRFDGDVPRPHAAPAQDELERIRVDALLHARRVDAAFGASPTPVASAADSVVNEPRF